MIKFFKKYPRPTDRFLIPVNEELKRLKESLVWDASHGSTGFCDDEGTARLVKNNGIVSAVVTFRTYPDCYYQERMDLFYNFYEIYEELTMNLLHHLYRDDRNELNYVVSSIPYNIRCMCRALVEDKLTLDQLEKFRFGQHIFGVGIYPVRYPHIEELDLDTTCIPQLDNKLIQGHYLYAKFMKKKLHGERTEFSSYSMENFLKDLNEYKEE